jgi:hypothetical protein
MRRGHLGIASAALLVLLALPGAAYADIIDYIWEMSGAQEIGAVVLDGKIELGNSNNKELEFFGQVLKGNPTTQFAESRTRLRIEFAAYVSTGHNTGGLDYRKFQAQMLAVEPILEVKSLEYGWLKLYQGVAGLSLDWLGGPNIKSFGKIGFKFRPVGVIIKHHGRDRFEVAWNVRVYPDGFGNDQFGFGGLPPSGDRKSEVIWGGVSGGIIW